MNSPEQRDFWWREEWIEKRVGFAIRQRGANRGRGLHIKKRERGGVVKRDVDCCMVRVGIKQRKRGGRKFREGVALPVENDARPGVGVIRTQSRDSRNLERGRGR